jgi:hypothetical protein
MLSRLVSSRRALVVLAVVTLVVPSVVLGLYGMFGDWSAEGAPTSWGIAAWLVGPYLAFAALLLWAARSMHVGFRVAVAVTAVVVVLQSVLLDVLTLGSDEALAAVGVLAMPILFFGGAVVLAVVGLVLHLLRAGAAGEPLRTRSN